MKTSRTSERLAHRRNPYITPARLTECKSVQDSSMTSWPDHFAVRQSKTILARSWGIAELLQ
jgi:hypothetical protein